MMAYLFASLLVTCFFNGAVVSSTGGLLGGFTDRLLLKDASSDDLKEFTKVAVKAVELMSANQGRHGPLLKLVHPVSVSTQVVAGVNYDMVLDVFKNGERVTCHVLVSHLEPWLQGGTWSVKTLSATDPCAQETKKEQSAHLLGGEEELDETDRESAEKAAHWAEDRINSMSNSLFRLCLQKINKVKKQIVNGVNYHFQLTLVPTSCVNNDENMGKTLDECPVDNGNGYPQSCDVEVVDKRGELSLKDFHCGALKGKEKSNNHLIGGDGHDSASHGNGNNLIGGDDHDYIPHVAKRNLIGGDDHDLVPHAEKKNLIGGDGHDSQPHGNNNLIGGDTHDYVAHGEKGNLIGGDDHDFIPHAEKKNSIGVDNHDYIPHAKKNNLIGGGKHDYIPHGLMDIVDTKKPSSLRFDSGVHHMSILGGDDHDRMPHMKASCHQYLPEFKKFKATYEKLYAEPQEELQRFNIFCNNMEKVKDIQNEDQGTAKYGATQFADLTAEEFSQNYMGLKPSSQQTALPQAEIPKGPIPESWDWRDHGAVTPVKNQGTCGSCWAFSTTGNIEGQNAIHHQKLLSLSEQELVDCDKLDQGCNGGLPSNAYEAIMKLGGIETEGDYTYKGEDLKCKFDKSEVAVKLSGAVNISQNEDEIAAWLYHNGPISIGINAFAMQFYWGGIAHPWKIFCNPGSLDHGVLIVGYGKKDGEPYWIIKNSWGASWGEKGYYYVYRGDGVCGLNTMCTSAKVV